ncbi:MULTISPECIES: MFS transporter [Actinosynnema]|uniref:MFS transporter n=1 Tax=Actinosynnema TaxID=40566 RepID=UPI0020A404EB|nr:MFS transporter [Actinosynnema pretiosum]MCP2098639.1 putative arabinose efflux permease, MFS family [Actinosynnema pretiosum]
MSAEPSAPEQAGAPTPAPDRPLFRNRDFQALWISQFLAAIGKEAAEIAYPLLILATTGSATYAGAVSAVQLVVAGVMSLPGGSLTDRFDRRLIMVVCDLARVLLLVLFSFLVWTDQVHVVATFAVVVLSSAFLGVSNPAGLAAIKQLVPPSQLTQATAQNQIRFFGATVIGPPIGGSLFGIARALPFLSAAVSFLASALLLFLIRKPTQAPRPERTAATTPTGERGTIAGFRAIARQPVILILVIWAMGSNMAFNHSGMFLALIATAQDRGASEAVIGTTLAIAGGGGLVGSLLAAPILKHVRPTVILYYAVWIGPVCAALLTFIPGVLPLGVAVACVFLRAGVVGALIYGYIAALIPDRLQGRVIGAVMFLGMIAQPIGIFSIGAIFDLAGPTWVFAAMSVAGAAAALPTFSKHIRRLPSPEELAARQSTEDAS